MDRNQLRLSDDEAWQTAPTLDPVLAIDPDRMTNAQRIVDLARLGYLPPPVLDATWGMGKFWTIHLPDRIVGADLDPVKARDVVANYQALPFATGAFPTVVYDPPYKAGGTTTDTFRPFNHRYGVNDANYAANVFDGLAECCRVAARFVIVKCQDQVNGGKVRWQTVTCANEAERLGWRVRDMLHLLNQANQPDGVTQQHARRNFSTFLVLTPKGGEV